MKKIYALLLICVFLLAGCGAATSDLLAVPEMPQMQKELIDTVDSVLGGGYEYSEPRSGLNRQPIQLMDLDGDGEDEGIAFLRDVAESRKTFIYIFENTPRGFILFDIIEGAKDELYTVSYSDVLGKSGYEIIVEWGLDGDKAHPIMVYDLSVDGAAKILEFEAIQYTVSDIDGDGTNDFLAVAKRGKNTYADVYVAEEGKNLRCVAEIPLVYGEGKLMGLKTGAVMPSKNGVVIERENGDMVLTDIIAHDGEKFLNVLGKTETGIADAGAADVNGDGIIEIPRRIGNVSDSDKHFFGWSVLNEDKNLVPSSFTYHVYSEGWYLLMPAAWSGAVIAERTAVRSGEVEIRFFTREHMQGDAEEYIKAPLFSIYVLTGDLRDERAAEEGRFIITTRDNTVFAAKIISESYLATDINEDFVKSIFRDIENNWFSEILFA